MDHGCEGSFGVIAMECKKNMPRCVSENDRESEKGGEEKIIDKYFATSNGQKINLPLPPPDVFLRRKRVVWSPLGLYAILLAISYMLCVQYCDK